MVCKRCLINMHDACYEYDDENNTCCDAGVTNNVDYYTKDIEDDKGEPDSSRRGHSRDSSLKDPQSTGRKRAAVAYPLSPDAPCEWQGLLRAGGGPHPIVGCKPEEKRTQTHRHHGPDKNTLNNETGNVHRICAFCHNRWHAANDPHYDPTDIINEHDAMTRATADDQKMVEYEEAMTARLKVVD